MHFYNFTIEVKAKLRSVNFNDLIKSPMFSRVNTPVLCGSAKGLNFLEKARFPRRDACVTSARIQLEIRPRVIIRNEKDICKMKLKLSLEVNENSLYILYILSIKVAKLKIKLLIEKFCSFFSL